MITKARKHEMGEWVGQVNQSRRFTRGIKRGFDIVVAALALVIVLPILLLTALLIYLEDRRSPLFRQPRIGRGGETFEVFKLRTMYVHDLSTGEVGQVHQDHPLVSRVGRWARRFKIDELPQLYNVLRGDMSLVGPRPDLIHHLAGYSRFQWRRLEAPPGLTGWAQVNGSVTISWDERIRLDVWYIDHWSLGLDGIILLKTAGVVLFGERPNEKAISAARDHARRVDPNA